jgi:IclR family transcriptional regulator, acetate operon repressor
MSRKEDNVPATLRSFAVLEALVESERAASLTDIVKRCALPKPTVYRMLAMLETAGLVVRDPGAARYSPGPRLASLGLRTMQNGSLSAARHAILGQLVEKIGETCNFTMLHAGEVMYLDRVEAAWPLRMNLTSGSRVPLHCTASGKLLLAYMAKPARDRMLANLSYTRYTESTISSRKALETELSRIRKQKHAVDNEEYHAGLVCVAVPTRSPGGRPCAAIAVHAPMSRMPLEKALEHLPLLRQACEAME